MMKRLFCLALLTIFATMAGAAEAFKVVVHSGNPSSSLTQRDVSEMLMKRKTTWPGGSAVLPVDLIEASSARTALSNRVHGKSTAAIKSYWHQQIFSGRGTPPIEFRTDDEVVAFVRANPNAIGYVSATAAAEGVKVVSLR